MTILSEFFISLARFWRRCFPDDADEAVRIDSATGENERQPSQSQTKVAATPMVAPSSREMDEALQGVARLLAMVVESHEIYTVGHERRVAELVKCMADEMGLPDEQKHCLVVTSLLHDIGKLAVPTDMYGKPDHFSEIEFMLIQSHCREGYNLLQPIPFPWPLADIVLQHHERLDGSGYPEGLMSDAILPEAKIMAVADVVEAMTAQRPHRPPITISVALQRIQEDRDTVLDAAAVDACVAVFDKGFVFPEVTTPGGAAKEPEMVQEKIYV